MLHTSPEALALKTVHYSIHTLKTPITADVLMDELKAMGVKSHEQQRAIDYITEKGYIISDGILLGITTKGDNIISHLNTTHHAKRD